MKSLIATLGVIASLLIAGCGGGGGSNDSAKSDDDVNITNLTLDAAPTASLAASQTNAAALAQEIQKNASELVSLASVDVPSTANTLSRGAVTTMQCSAFGGDTGSGSYSQDSNIGSGGITAGSTMTTTYNNCTYTYGGYTITINGVMTMTYTRFNSYTDYSVTTTYNNFTSAMTGNGYNYSYGPVNATYTIDYANGTISYSSNLSNGGASNISRSNVQTNGNNITITSATYVYNSTSVGGVIKVVFDNWTYNTVTGNPVSGSVTVTGANGNTVRIDAADSNYTVTYTINGAVNSYAIGGTSSGNNGALLSGAAIGKGTTAISNLRKQIAVTLLGQDSSFTIGTAFSTRWSASDDYAYIILPVTNTGNKTRCFVKLAGLTYRDASGVALVSDDFTYVDGSVRKLSSSGLFTNTCLAPGETGMVGDIQANLYSSVARMEFTLESSDGGTAPSARVIPQSYTVPSTGSWQSLSISVTNLGSGSVIVGEPNLHPWFLLDDAMQPLSWGFAEDTISPHVVPASGTVTLANDYISYSGSGSNLLVFVDFDDADMAASLKDVHDITRSALKDCAASLPTDDFVMCQHENRNRELILLESIQRATTSQTE